MTLKEIAAIAMDEADFYEAAQDAQGGQVGANSAPGAKPPKVGTEAAPTSAKGLNAQKPDDTKADWATKFPGSFGNTSCRSKNKDGCRNHKTGIFAEKGSPFAKLDASGNQVFATPEQLNSAPSAGDEEEGGNQEERSIADAYKNVGEAIREAGLKKIEEEGRTIDFKKGGAGYNLQKQEHPDWKEIENGDGTVYFEPTKEWLESRKNAKTANPTAETEKVVEEVKVVLSDPKATEEKKAEAEQKVVSTLAPTEQRAVSTLNDLSEQGNGDKVIEAMEKVSANAVATENDKVAAAFIAETALETMKKQNASAEAVQAAEQKVQSIKDAANAAGSDKAQTPAPQNGTLRERPTAEMQKKLADAVKNSFGKLYDDFVEDVRNVADGQCFAAGDDESEDHYFVKKDGKIYRADANDQPVGDALSEEEVMCAMIGEGHLWVDGKRTAGGEAPQPQQQAPAPAQETPDSGIQKHMTSTSPSQSAPHESKWVNEKDFNPQGLDFNNNYYYVHRTSQDAAKNILTGEGFKVNAGDITGTAMRIYKPEDLKNMFDSQREATETGDYSTDVKGGSTAVVIKVPKSMVEVPPSGRVTDDLIGSYILEKYQGIIPTDNLQVVSIEGLSTAPTISEEAPAAANETPAPAQTHATPAPAPAPSSASPAAPSPAPAETSAGTPATPSPAEAAQPAQTPATPATSVPAAPQAAPKAGSEQPAESSGQAETSESDDLKTESVAYLGEVQPGEFISMKDDDGNPDSGANKMVKASDGNFYRVDADGKPTGQGFTAEQAYAEMKRSHDPVPKGQSIEDHIRTCKANPRSNCPFLRQHIGEMSAEQQHQVFGGEPPQSDGLPVTAPSLANLVRRGAIDEGTARAVETGLTTTNTGLGGDDLDALRESAAQALAGAGAESIRRTLADLATVAAARRINVNDPNARERAVSESLANAFTPSTEEGKRRAEELINRAERWGVKLTDAEKNHYRRAAEIEVRNENQRKALDALKAATEEAVKLGSGLGRMLEGLADRQLTDLQSDNIEAMKKIISEAKNDRALLAARNKLEKYLTEQGLDKPMESDPSWNAISTPEDFGQNDAEAQDSPAKQAYEAELADLQKKMDEDDNFSAEDYDRGVESAAAKARAAGYDPSIRAGGDLYASGISDKTFNKAFGGESILLKDAKKAKPTEAELNQEAADSAALIEDLFRKRDKTSIDKKTNRTVTTRFGVEVAGTSRNGNDIVVKVKFDEGADPKILTSMRDRLALALGKPDLQIKKVSGKNEAEITYSHKGQDYHMLSDELKDADTRRKIAKSGVPLVLGRAGDKNVVEDMRSGTNPHLLITGGTNSGKSRVGMNILAGWMMKDPKVCTPFVIDPKGEFEGACKDTAGIGYSGKGGNAQAALRFLNEEMNRRLSILKDYKNIDEYNKRHPNNPMPMMPILFDEISKTLNEDASGQSEALFNNLAKLCRSAGMNIVGLTQGARDIKQDTLKNLGRRFALKAANNTESAATLGAGHHEATRSKGNGDGFYSADGSDPIRIQAPLLNDDDPDSGRDDLMRLKRMRNAKGHRKAVSRKERQEKAKSRFSVTR